MGFPRDESLGRGAGQSPAVPSSPRQSPALLPSIFSQKGFPRMFYRSGILEKSTLLDGADVLHGFSTRAGGVSTLAHTASMNIARGRGDSDETVLRNIGILARSVSDGTLGAADTVYAHQIHSAKIRLVTAAERGQGVTLPAGEDGDGFITADPGVLLMISMADCTPILFSALRSDGSGIVSAVHAGWRGCAAGIAPEALRLMCGMGGELPSVRCAIGQAIRGCCYEVKEDFRDVVRALRGEIFAQKHIRSRGGKLFADVPEMNRCLLLDAGLREDQIDLSPRCTACSPDEFHSHRASRGLRGAMGAVIAIPQGTRTD